MARAGYCSRCGRNVWLDGSGGCVAGHRPECISGIYDAPAPAPSILPVPPSGKGDANFIWLVALPVIGVFLLLVCGILTAIAVPVFSSAKVNAQRRACYANMRVIQGALMVYAAENEDAKPPAGWAEVTSRICPSVITSVPACGTGGVYGWIPGGGAAGGQVRCTVHGSVPPGEEQPPED